MSKQKEETRWGKIKSFRNESRVAFVVYNANNNWDGDHWKDYTAAATNYDRLSFTEPKLKDKKR